MVKAIFELLRPRICFMAVLGVLTGAIVSRGFSIENLLLGLAGTFFITASGNVINDFFDYEIDKINKPSRPLPSKRISKNEALLLFIITAILGNILIFKINIYLFLFALFNTFVAFLYAFRLKRMTFIGNLGDSWLAASTFLFGGLLGKNFIPVTLLSVLGFFANLGREIYGDIEDVKGDRKQGAKTLPITIGIEKSLLLGRFFILVSVSLSYLPFFLGLLNFDYVILVTIANVIFIYSLLQSPSKNQEITKIAIFMVLFGFIIGTLR
jgi:geranylgeranylglycerol-phosphate geranylgeranyltransferase